MDKYFTDVTQLSIGNLYEMEVKDYRSRIPWFEGSQQQAADRPDNGSHVVYLGRHPSFSEGVFYHRFLSSDGRLYRVYNTDFVYGLKETQHEIL